MQKETNPAIEIFRISNTIRRRSDQTAFKQKMDKLAGTNGRIICFISDHHDEDVFQRDIESTFSITRSAASKAVDILVARGLIQRSPVEYDARLKKLSLTPEGSKVTTLLEDNHNALNEIMAKGFTKEEFDNLTDYLIRIRKNLEEE